MSLSDVKIRNTKVGGKPIKLSDGQGLYLHCYPDGKKIWRYNYRWLGKQKTMTFGRYPEMTLAAARAEHQRNRSILMDTTNPRNPMDVRKREKAGKPTFEAIATEWHSKQKARWADTTANNHLFLFEAHLFKLIGDRLIDEIEPPDLLAALRKIEAKGLVNTAHRCRALCGQVFRFAVASGLCQRDVAADLKGALASKAKPKHHAAITDPKAIGGLMRAISTYDGQVTTRYALQLLAYTAVRQGELRFAKWAEIDFEERLWRIPPERMKVAREHWVPLSKQAIQILSKLQAISKNDWILPSVWHKSLCMSKTTLNGALRILGYTKTQMTPHGFRSMFSTLLHDQGWSHELIELSLSHRVGSTTSQAYNHSRRIEERRKLMQSWADYIDSLRDGATVIPLHQSRAA